jgi:hypothetical protein
MHQEPGCSVAALPLTLYIPEHALLRAVLAPYIWNTTFTQANIDYITYSLSLPISYLLYYCLHLDVPLPPSLPVLILTTWHGTGDVVGTAASWSTLF